MDAQTEDREIAYLRAVVSPLIGGQFNECHINKRIDEKGVMLELLMPGNLMGPVIGKGGENAKAIRTLLRTLGGKEARYSLKIVEIKGS